MLLSFQQNSIKLTATFELIVKLLSPEYSKIVRNYNLRAKLGEFIVRSSMAFHVPIIYIRSLIYIFNCFSSMV